MDSGPEADAGKIRYDQWQGLVRYLGRLSTLSQWEQIKPLFELVKQLSTSALSVLLTPVLIDEQLYLAQDAFDPGGPYPPRIHIETPDAHTVRFSCISADRPEGESIECRREAALDVLSRLAQAL